MKHAIVEWLVVKYYKLLNKIACEHEYISVARYKYGIEEAEVAIYCPKCEKKRRVKAYKWRIISGIQEARKEYEEVRRRRG